MSEPKVAAIGLSKTFTVGSGRSLRQIAAVADVSFAVAAGETLAVVGESGCGKTTLGRMLALLQEPSAGSVTLDGVAPPGWRRRELKPLRRHVQMVFQDPVSSLNPRHTVESILTEPLRNFAIGSAASRRQQAEALLESVGLAPEDLRRYPHEFSGGQRQRITIARALALTPGVIIADEPVSALDVSVQSQVLNLLTDLRDQHDLTFVFISHDLAVVRHLADRIAVMYLGRIVELAPRDVIFETPAHPYTRALLASVPTLSMHKRRMGRVLRGDPPSPANPPAGCAFHPRCEHATERCRVEPPALEADQGGRLIACHQAGSLG